MSRNTVTKRTISLEAEVESKGKARAKRLGFHNSFSAYINQLIRGDLARESRKGVMGGKGVA